ncbi:Uncharacterized protein FWK35_00003162 [Aphis craccivora]|uniref:Trimethylguanosine synthase n=1 Tax=Aphis craccivora TaxID=307492 RepID=A0A6G0ZKP6_APHCR|nr:Uncharacterized protein FWK35_00003162 [Aphis craccivora]
MNRNYPKVKSSPKWNSQPSVNNQTNFMKKPNYSSRAGKMVEVLYGRGYSSSRNNNVTLLCTYFVTNKRDRRFPNRFKPNENETSSDDFHSDKRKLCTTAIKNEPMKIQQSYDKNLKNSNKINTVLEGLGFVCNDDKIHTDCASKIHCYNVNKQYNTGYGTKTYTPPKSKKKHSFRLVIEELRVMGVSSSDLMFQIINRNIPILQTRLKLSESYKQKENSQKAILPSETFQHKTYYHKNYNPILQNLSKPSESYKQKENCRKSILPSETFQKKNYHHQNYTHDQYSTTQKNTSSNQMNHSVKQTHHFFKNQQIPIKYWAMRHMLFSKFDSGIQLDLESFYSVCPEPLSYHIAKRCKNNVVLDPFCGAGGSIIQLAMICKKAVDIDPNKIKMARHNAEIYGVADKIEFLVGDIFSIYPTLKADVVFMSPPWGGPAYSLNKCYSIKTMCNDHHVGGGFAIFDIVKTIAPNIAFHMPKNTNILECVLLAKDFGKVEIQQNVINGKLNSLTAFFGNFNWNSN